MGLLFRSLHSLTTHVQINELEHDNGEVQSFGHANKPNKTVYNKSNNR